jgi:hypothetical protein
MVLPRFPALLAPVLAVGAAAVVLVPAAGCSGNDKASAGISGSKLPEGVRSEAIDHESCDEGGNHRVVTTDSNGDGKPDIKAVYDKSTSKLLCRIIDLNHDQKPDMYEYFDDGGTVRRREYAFGDDGVVDQIDEYENGHLVRRERDTTGQHKIDTWDTFDPNAPLDAKTGRPAHPIHRERDTTGDGRVDQWWDWAPDGTITIAMDKTGSGHPDPATKIVIEAGAMNGPGAAAGADAGPPTVTWTAEGGTTTDQTAPGDGGTE